MYDEIKVVILLKEGRGSIGIQSPDCDPLFVTFEGTLGQALERVPGLLEEARQKWDSNPQYPKCETELPSQKKPAPVASRSSPKQTTSSAERPMF